MICKSPSHIYSSALQFSPSSSWLHQHHNTEYLQGPSVRWGACFCTVQLYPTPQILACWKDTVAVSSRSKYITTLDAVTGSGIAVLSGHPDQVLSLTFSIDGTSLVSGSYDKTIKLWDMQTGGVVRTFQGHTALIHSVSISPNCTTIASGSDDETIHLWNNQTGECYYIIQQGSSVHSVLFFPLRPQIIISISGRRVWEWGIDGQKISKYDGSYAAFSPDGAKFVLCNGAVVAKFHIDNTLARHCCFSPDGRLIAIAAYHTNPELCLIETFIGHTDGITSLVFSSPTSLISVSHDGSMRFWQIGASSTPPDIVDPKSIVHTSPIKSIPSKLKMGLLSQVIQMG